MKNMSPTFTSDVEGPALMVPKKEENTFSMNVENISKVAQGGIE